jgi:hypothetical protein
MVLLSEHSLLRNGRQSSSDRSNSYVPNSRRAIGGGVFVGPPRGYIPETKMELWEIEVKRHLELPSRVGCETVTGQ